MKKYDLAFLNDYFDNDKSSVAKILEMYLNETPKEISAIEKSILRNEMASAKAITHKIKANVAMLGIHESSTFINDMQLLQPADPITEKISEQFRIFKQEVLSALEEIKADFFETPLS